jgi:hypothetical protein
MTNQVQNQVLFPSETAIGSGSGPPAPSAPSNLDIDTDTSDADHVILTWTNNAVPTTNDVWVSLNGAPYVFLASVAGATATYTDTSGGWADGDVRDYKVQACAGSCSAFSNVASGSYNLGALQAGAYNYPTLIIDFAGIDTAGSGVATQLNLPKLRKIKGSNLGFTGEPLATFDVSQLAIVEGSVSFNSCANLTTANFPALVSTGGGFDLGSCASLATLTAPVLATINGTLDLSNSGTFSVSFPALTSVVSIACLTSGLTSFAANALTGVQNDVSFSGSGDLASIGFNALQDIGSATNSGLDLSGIGGAAISFPVLNNIGGPGGGTFTCANSAITSLNLAGLAGVGGDFDCSNTGSLAVINIASLGTIFNGGFNLNTCSALTTLTLGNGTNFIDLSTSPLLANLTLPNFLFPDGGFISFAGCSIPAGNSAAGTGINGILARGVASGVTSDEFDLDGGSNAGLSALSVQGTADYNTLTTAGNIVNINV